MKLAELRRATEAYLEVHGSTPHYRIRINHETDEGHCGLAPPVTKDQQARGKAALTIYKAVLHIKSLLIINRHMRKLVGVKGMWR